MPRWQEDVQNALNKLAGTGQYAQHTIEAKNATVMNGGSHGAKLAAASTPYKTARVTALKPSGVADTLPGANTGTVYIGQGGGDDCRYSIPLTQGQSMDLLAGGDLADVYLFVASANDGVIVEYTT